MVIDSHKHVIESRPFHVTFDKQTNTHETI